MTIQDRKKRLQEELKKIEGDTLLIGQLPEGVPEPNHITRVAGLIPRFSYKVETVEQAIELFEKIGPLKDIVKRTDAGCTTMTPTDSPPKSEAAKELWTVKSGIVLRQSGGLGSNYYYSAEFYAFPECCDVSFYVEVGNLPRKYRVTGSCQYNRYGQPYSKGLDVPALSGKSTSYWSTEDSFRITHAFEGLDEVRKKLT